MWKINPIERFTEEERAIVSKLQEQRVTPLKMNWSLAELVSDSSIPQELEKRKMS
jgi:hypothetical protein